MVILLTILDNVPISRENIFIVCIIINNMSSKYENYPEFHIKRNIFIRALNVPMPRRLIIHYTIL